VKRSAVVALLLLAPLSAEAQTLSFTPEIGFYVPTDKFVSGIVGEPFDAAELTAGPSFGARMGLWFGDRFGVDVSANYVPTTFKVLSGSSELASENASLWNGAAQAVFYIVPRTSPVSFHVNGGIGLVSRGGAAFELATDKSDVAGVFGAGVGVRLGGMQLNVGADLYAYTAKIEDGIATESSFQQKDIQLKLGLGIQFGGSQNRR